MGAGSRFERTGVPSLAITIHPVSDMAMSIMAIVMPARRSAGVTTKAMAGIIISPPGMAATARPRPTFRPWPPPATSSRMSLDRAFSDQDPLSRASPQ
jgi:hypothetical protein